MKPPNKHMLRAVTHKVLGRGRPSLVPSSAPRARVLIGQRAGADVGRYAAVTFALVAAILSLVLPGVAQATSPLREIVVTPANAESLGFEVKLRGRHPETTYTVVAPRRLSGDCSPALSGSSVWSAKGQLVYSQTTSLTGIGEAPQLIGTLSASAAVIQLWINYLCPPAHAQDGARYIVNSSAWKDVPGLR
jgi:hypothetical protein